MSVMTTVESCVATSSWPEVPPVALSGLEEQFKSYNIFAVISVDFTHSSGDLKLSSVGRMRGGSGGGFFPFLADMVEA